MKMLKMEKKMKMVLGGCCDGVVGIVVVMMLL